MGHLHLSQSRIKKNINFIFIFIEHWTWAVVTRCPFSLDFSMSGALIVGETMDFYDLKISTIR